MISIPASVAPLAALVQVHAACSRYKIHQTGHSENYKQRRHYGLLCLTAVLVVFINLDLLFCLKTGKMIFFDILLNLLVAWSRLLSSKQGTG